MVLLHALGEHAGSWAPVVERFAASYRVHTFDLRGHGDSDWSDAYSSALIERDVCAALDALGLHDVVLAGHSMGGVVCYRVAASRPELVRRLVIEDAVPPFVRDRAVPEEPDEPVPFDWAVVRAFVEEMNEGDPAAWERLARITAPTLVVSGGPESPVPPDLFADAAGRIPAATLVTIPVGHEVHAHAPEEFADVVLDWLAS